MGTDKINFFAEFQEVGGEGFKSFCSFHEK